MRQRLVIEFDRADTNYWIDIWHYRELFAVLAWRDLSVRYKETVFGVLWALLRPFLTMLVLAIIFGRLAKLPSDGDVPYPLMVLVGMILWSLFSASWTEAGSSLIRDSSLITKVYFPRLIVPAASMAVNFVDFLISFAMLVLMMCWYRFLPGWQIILLPLFMLLAFVANIGPGLWIAALKSRREMKASSTSSTATAEAGNGPPSKTGNSATDSPGPFTASTCSRPPMDVLKMRTLPRAMMCSPLHGSPSENINSPVLNSLRTVRAASICSSGCERPESNAVFPRQAKRSVRGALTGKFYQQATLVTALRLGTGF